MGEHRFMSGSTFQFGKGESSQPRSSLQSMNTVLSCVDSAVSVYDSPPTYPHVQGKPVSCICQFQLIVTHQLKSLTLKVSIHTLSPSNLKSGRGESRLSRGFQISFSTSNFPLPLERIKWLWKLVSATENKTFSATEMSEFGVNI